MNLRHDALLTDHTPEAVRARLAQDTQHSYLRDFVYGAVDGLVTTFAVVSGVAGAGLSVTVIVILGVANLIADGFSMAAGNFLASRTEAQRRDSLRLQEIAHIKAVPEGEKEEIRQIYAAKGFSGTALEHIVQVITNDQRCWVETMLQEELGLAPRSPNPWRAALATFFAFVLVGAIPLLAFLWNMTGMFSIAQPFLVSSIITAVAFFSVGAVKARFVEVSWWRAGMESLLVGGSAAMIAYAVGYWLGLLA